MAQLRCENVALGYEAKVILEGLHFTVYPGDYLLYCRRKWLGQKHPSENSAWTKVSAQRND